MTVYYIATSLHVISLRKSVNGLWLLVRIIWKISNSLTSLFGTVCIYEEEKLMGRRRHSKHSQKRHSQRTKRRGGRSEPSQPLRRAHGSDPECGVRREGVTDSPRWNSLDEQSLAGPSPPPSLSALVAADYVYKSGLSSDEMEVTRKLSCLNFSVLPCSGADAALMMSTRDHHHHHQQRHQYYHQDGGVLPADESLNRVAIHAADMSDVEAYSELPSATQLDFLLPTLEHQDEDGRRLEAMDCEQRRRRKRPSRKKPNRRTKKIRLHHHVDNSTANAGASRSINVHPLSSNFIYPTVTDLGKDRDVVVAGGGGQLRRVRSFRRSKRQSRSEHNDPMLCILSDTSAMCEFEQERGMADDDFFDATPPAEGIPPIGMIMEGLGCIGGPSVSLEELPNESDLTETTSDRYTTMYMYI